MGINREGYKIVTSIVVVLVLYVLVFFFLLPILSIWLFWVLLFLLFTKLCFVLSFFREPKRAKIHDESLLFSPADGTIVACERVYEEEYFGDYKLKISVFMSLTNVHMNWYPVSGRVDYFKYHPGQFLVAWLPKSSVLNERTTTVIDTGKDKVLFRQIAGFVARRIVAYSQVGNAVEQNTKCGFIKFGSRVDVFLPLEAETFVNIGDKVTGGQTPLAKFK